MNSFNYLIDKDEEKTVVNRLCFRTFPLGERYPSKHGNFDEVKFITQGRFWTGELGNKKGHKLKSICNGGSIAKSMS